METENRFKTAREAAGLSIGQVANKTGYAKNVVIGFDDGSIFLWASPIKTFSKLFKVSSEWLAGEDVEMKIMSGEVV